MADDVLCPRCGNPLDFARGSLGRYLDEEEWSCPKCNEDFLYEVQTKRRLLYANSYKKSVPVKSHMREGRPVRNHLRRKK